jgi:hypothetical protein
VALRFSCPWIMVVHMCLCYNSARARPARHPEVMARLQVAQFHPEAGTINNRQIKEFRLSTSPCMRSDICNHRNH